MKNNYFLKFLIIIMLSGTWQFAMAQFGDVKHYPFSVTPSELKDSVHGHLWGEVFGSFYTKVHADSINTPTYLKTGATQYSQIPKNFDAFSLQRVYLGYDYFFNSHISAHVILAHEELYDGNSVKNNVDNTIDRSFYLKFCTLEFDNVLYKGGTLNVGAVQTPSYSMLEQPFWGYRSLERTILDMRGIASSNDVGASYGGKIWSERDSVGQEKACLGYNVLVGNGSGPTPDDPNLSTSSPYKRYYGDIYLKLFHDKLVMDLYGDGRTLNWSPCHQTNIVGRGFIGYKTKDFNISFEYFEELMTNQAFILKGSDITKGDSAFNRIQSGFSIEGAATLLRNKHTGGQVLGVVLRYDVYNPDNNYNANDTYSSTYSSSNAYVENFALVALDYQPIGQIHVMPNIWYDGFHNRALYASGLKLNDNDIVLRLTLYFQIL